MYSLTKATNFLLKHYYIGSENISSNIMRYNNYKLRHSNGVLEWGRNIILKMRESTKLEKKLINKSEITFLLHDIARFYQNNKKRVLKGNEFEHGDKGYNILKENGYEESISLAVKYHNKFNIDGLYREESFGKMSETDKNETLFLLEIVRDADKLHNMIYGIYDMEKI